jgi:drug/metabolite transporter (DMT)-like permease
MSDPAHEHRRQRLIGIGLMSGAVACFACLDAMAKYLGGHIDPLQVVGMRFISAFLLALIFSNPLSHPGLLRATRPGLQIVRGLMMLSTTIRCRFPSAWSSSRTTWVVSCRGRCDRSIPATSRPSRPTTTR